MIRAPHLSILALLAAVGSAGCEGSPRREPTFPDTSGVALSDIEVRVTVTSVGSSALCEAELVLPGGESARLGNGDVVRVRADDADDRPLVEVTGARPPRYAVLMPSSATSVSLAFARGPEVAAAEVDLPPAFTLGAPARPSRAEPIPLTWEPGGEERMTLAFAGPCVVPSRGMWRDADARSSGFVLQPADFVPMVDPCTLSVEATRERTRSLGASGLSVRSSATTRQVRTLTIETLP
jgi:hypothetical protein